MGRLPRRGLLFLSPLPVLVVVFAGMCTPGMAKCGSSDEVLLARVRACPRAVEMLGDDIALASFGCASGRSKGGCDSGIARWDIGIGGSRGDGRVSYSARMTDGVWTLGRAEVTVGGQTVDALTCAAAAAPASSAAPGSGETTKATPGSGGINPWDDTRAPAAARPHASTDETMASEAMAPVGEVAPVELTAKVLRSTHRAVQVGATCRAQLTPTAAASAHAKVTCGAQVVYDGAGSYLHVPGTATTFMDAVETDGTPRLQVAGAGTTLTMAVRDASFEIVIASR